MKITSVNNENVKETSKLLQKKYRDKLGLFIIEGEKGLLEAINANLDIIKVFSSSEHVRQQVPDKVEYIETTEAVISKITDTKTPPPCVTVAKQRICKLDNLKKMKKVILLEGIKDTGNLGTILRSAVAFKADSVVLYGDTIDLYNPRCVRASVGNLWKIPVYEINDFKVLEEYFTEFERIATLPEKEDTIRLANYSPQNKLLIMFGSEANGLSDELVNFATHKVTIEMSDNVESLNLGISVAVFLYKVMNK